MDKMPRNRENLYYYNPYEQKVFATLKQINWCPPKSPNFIPSDTAAKPDSRSARPPAPSREAWLKRVTSISRSEPIPSNTETFPSHYRQISLLQKISPEFPLMYITAPPITNTSDNGWRGNGSAKSSSIHYNNDSDYSDDLYGTGRPLRPSLINSDQRVQEWQLSAQGNPEVTVFLEDTFQPDSHEEISVSNHELTAFLENEFQASVTSKCPKPPSSKIDKNSSVFDDLAVLITVDEPTGTTIVVDVEEISVGNGTIIEEDSSMLADLDAAFTEGMEYRSAGLDYRCLSDDGTEIDSEFDKIEYEFQPVQPLSMDEIKILSNETEKTCTENESQEMVSSDAKVNRATSKRISKQTVQRHYIGGSCVQKG